MLALAVIGSYALAQNMAGPITLAVFAVIGWLMQRFDYPVAAAVVGPATRPPDRGRVVADLIK